MTKGLIDADVILNRAKPLVHQKAHEIQPFGHLVKLPIALAENVCKEGVTISTSCSPTRSRSVICTRSTTGKQQGRRSSNCICCSTSTTNGRMTLSTRSPSESKCSAG
jgi:hypothetical protein